MKAYLLALAGAILISSLVSALAPEGRMGKFLKGMADLFVFSIVLGPLVGLWKKQDLSFSEGKLSLDSDYLSYCGEALSKEESEEICRFLEESFSVSGEVSIERDEESLQKKKITVILSLDGISEENEHIDMANRICAALEEKFGCRTEVVWS